MFAQEEAVRKMADSGVMAEMERRNFQKSMIQENRDANGGLR